MGVEGNEAAVSRVGEEPGTGTTPFNFLGVNLGIHTQINSKYRVITLM